VSRLGFSSITHDDSSLSCAHACIKDPHEGHHHTLEICSSIADENLKFAEDDGDEKRGAKKWRGLGVDLNGKDPSPLNFGCIFEGTMSSVFLGETSLT